MALVPIIQHEIDSWILPKFFFVIELAAPTDSLKPEVLPDPQVHKLDRALKWITSIQTLY